ncbi:hypothetical protein EVAR_19437_1 [Eumeta japonica]|uniref:Uncharacterized protein n=1 Tax=Eumeta variegata TaxID=151549 RepID=A0A4C1TRS7_EUMVA|nr:hypothetical protein EVAR_19437_1 [Eumeta japonica]
MKELEWQSRILRRVAAVTAHRVDIAVRRRLHVVSESLGSRLPPPSSINPYPSIKNPIPSHKVSNTLITPMRLRMSIRGVQLSSPDNGSSVSSCRRILSSESSLPPPSRVSRRPPRAGRASNNKLD